MMKKSEERLRLALRYISLHPDLTADILSKEWDIPIDDAISICAQIWSMIHSFEMRMKKGKVGFKVYEKVMFERLMELE